MRATYRKTRPNVGGNLTRSRHATRRRDAKCIMGMRTGSTVHDMHQITSGEDITANVRAEMARRRVDQAYVAGLLGLSRGAVSDRLRGRSRLRVDELQKIAADFNVPLEQLLASATSEVSA